MGWPGKLSWAEEKAHYMRSKIQNIFFSDTKLRIEVEVDLNLWSPESEDEERRMTIFLNQ